MKNLKLSYKEALTLRDVSDCTSFCSNGVSLYLYSKYIIYSVKSVSFPNVIETNLRNIINASSDNKVVSFEYHYEKNTLVLCFFCGDIVTVYLGGQEAEIEVVGCVDTHIKAAEWSPEQEYLVVVTGEGNVIIMTNDFDPINEVSLHNEEFGKSQFITVGWGKKETQFHGSVGKAAAKSKGDPQALDEYNNSVLISWRGDGEYFAISTLHATSDKRYLRIFDREGILQYTSEESPGLEAVLHWQPAGSLMACTQRFVNKHVVSFYEKNGLKHGEFNLPFQPQEVTVLKLMWNVDSKIIFVWSEEKNPEAAIQDKGTQQTRPKKFIHLYATGNYHWYNKYTLLFTDKDIVNVIWDRRQANTLHIVTKKDNVVIYHKYSWLWVIDHSRGTTVSDQAIVAVIDGKKVLLTAFRRGITPPPMCTVSVNTPLSINSVAFISEPFCFSQEPGVNSGEFLVQLCDNSLVMFQLFEEKVTNIFSTLSCRQIKTLKIFAKDSDKKSDFELSNILWLTRGIIMCCMTVTSNEMKSSSYLAMINLDNSSDEAFIVLIKELSFAVNLLVSYPNSEDYICAQDVEGILYKVNLTVTNENVKGVEINPIFSNENPKRFAKVELAKDIEGNVIIFGVDFSNKFYMNNQMVTDNVTSFTVHDNHLLLTTLQHRLLCFLLDSDILKKFQKNISDIDGRRIERGSRIVVAVPEDSRVILQMPRGNLECIQPRVLSLSKIGSYLKSCNYLEAFDMMRKQRINLNLLFDHDPESFLLNVGEFIERVKNPSWISLFLSELMNEDVTQTMYSMVYSLKDRSSNVNCNGDKVCMICDVVRKTLLGRNDSEVYTLPLLTSYIKKGKTEDLEMALLTVKKIKEKEVSKDKVLVSSNEALHYILYLIDVEELYRIALGLYDFDLVLLVANKSQKDPKEYIPFLNELKKMEQNYQKFTIDKYLKRYEKALKHILNCGDENFVECLKFINQYKLHKSALSYIPNKTERYKQVALSYAEELLGNRLYYEAGMMYVRADMYEPAIEAFKEVNEWREIISCCKQMEYDSHKQKELFKTVASSLNEAKQFSDAAIVHSEYLHDINGAVLNFCQGKLWDEAYRISELHSKCDLIENNIKPGIIGHFHALVLQLNSMSETFQNQKTRLNVVRTQKALAKITTDENIVDDERDMYSDISTVRTASNATSRTSARSYRSSKNRRKHERKLLSLKEGSPFEDLALVASLHQVVTVCLSMKEEVKNLNKMLIKIEKDDLAKKLQSTFKELLHKMETSKTEIWNEELTTGVTSYGPDSTSNMIAEIHQRVGREVLNVGLEPHLRFPPRAIHPVRWEFETLNF